VAELRNPVRLDYTYIVDSALCRGQFFFISPIGAKIENLHLDSSTGYLEFVEDKEVNVLP
jgi:hypothetical protein